MDVRALLDTHGVRYVTNHRDVRHGWVGIADGCPWCGQRGNQLYLAVNLSTGSGNCWRCGYHSLADILVACARVPLAAAIAATKGLKRPAHGPDRPVGKFTPPPGVGPLAPAHAAYLRDRRFDPDELARLWGIGGIGLSKRLPWSIYIPITHNGETVSWTTRSIGKKRRYVGAELTEESIPAKSILYGADYARHAIIIHEGPVDVWATGPGAVCTFGLGYSEAQINAMASFAVRAICFDTEPEAQRRARELASILAPFPGRTEVVELETGKDAAAADKTEVAELRAAFLDETLPTPL